MAFIESNDVVEQVVSATLNPPLRNAVLPRTLEGSANRPDGHRPHCDGNLQTILGVAIEDEIEESGDRGKPPATVEQSIRWWDTE